MKGGKRNGAGRKKGEESKRIRVPIGILEEVEKLIRKHKNTDIKQDAAIKKNSAVENKANNLYPAISKEQVVILREVLFDSGYAKSKTQARKLTSSTKQCKNTFLDIIHKLDESQVKSLQDIPSLYTID